MRFERAAVIGTGQMGPGTAASLAMGGLKTVVLSRSAGKAEEALARARGFVESLGGDAALLSASTDEAGVVGECDIVVESAPENLAFKQELFARLDALAPPHAALTSNTSGLSITAVQSACARPERVLTTHFWNPPHLMPLVEIVLGARTDAAVGEAVRALLVRCGKTPVMVKQDRPGQLGNRLQMALYREAISIVEQGIASVEDVDLAIKTGFGLRLPVYGCFEHMDMVGLDLVKSILDYAATDIESRPESPKLLGEKVAAGDLGVKSGRGFYDWSVKSATEVRATRDDFVRDFVASRRGRVG